MKAWLDQYQAYLTLAGAVLVFCLGAWVGNSIASADTALQALDFAEQKQTAVEAVLKKLGTAKAAEREALDRLATANLQREKLSLEKDREIRRLTTGRPCLSAPVVRLLNLSADSQPGAVSTAVAGADAGDAGFASDTDVAQWARLCRDRYDTCRGYLSELRLYFQGAGRE